MRILVIEDDKATAYNIFRILRHLATAIDLVELGEDGVLRAMERAHELIILDLSLPDIHGLETVHRLRAADINTPVLILTGDISMDMLVECLESGADDYMTKPFFSNELIARVHALERRAVEYTKTLAEARDASARMAPLTPREREVVVQLLAGSTSKAAARELGISPRTVEVHRAKIMEKLHAHSLSDVVRIALAAERLAGDPHSDHLGANRAS